MASENKTEQNRLNFSIIPHRSVEQIEAQRKWDAMVFEAQRKQAKNLYDERHRSRVWPSSLKWLVPMA